MFMVDISYIIIYHHISSYIIIYHHISSYIIIYHHISSYIIIYHHISSYIIIYHHISSYIIIYHHISSYIIIYHHISMVNWLSQLVGGHHLAQKARDFIQKEDLFYKSQGFYHIQPTNIQPTNSCIFSPRCNLWNHEWLEKFIQLLD